MKILIFGSTGWIGRATLKYLAENYPTSDITLVSSAKKSFKYKDKTYQVFDNSYLNSIKDREYDYFFNYAFPTGYNAVKYSEEDFISITNKIINESSEFINKNNVKKTLLTSTGAVYWNGTEKETLYSKQKMYQETLTEEMCESTGTKYSIARIFALLANHYQSDYDYAFSSFVKQAINDKNIKINSKIKVVRSYLVFDNLLDYFFNNNTRVFDAWNFNLDIYKLAEAVSMYNNSRITIDNDYFNSKDVDEYVSKDENFMSNFSEEVKINEIVESIISYTESEKNMFKYF